MTKTRRSFFSRILAAIGILTVAKPKALLSSAHPIPPKIQPLGNTEAQYKLLAFDLHKRGLLSKNDLIRVILS